MSILIKIPMPKNCAECPCLRHDSIDGVNAYQCNITFGIRKNIDRKPKWCPLVDLGEHGDLIDKNSLKETLDYYIHEAGWGEEINKALVWVKDDFINSEPTVIEAEDG